MLNQLLSVLLFVLGIPASGDAAGYVMGTSTATPSATIKTTPTTAVKTTPAPTTKPKTTGTASKTATQSATPTYAYAYEAKWQDAAGKYDTALTTGMTAFTKKVATLTDAKKKSAATSVQSRLSAYHARRLAWAKQTIRKMSKLLDRARSRAVTEEQKQLVKTADTVIADAAAVITVQGAKTYIVSVGTDATIKNDLESTRRRLAADTVTIDTAVKDARVALMKAVAAIEPAAKLPQTQPTHSVKPTGAATTAPHSATGSGGLQ